MNRGPYKISRGALLALREVTEDHLVRVFEGSNLACMHRDWCTLAPRDIRLYHHLNGDEDCLGIEPCSQEAKELNWQKFKSGRLTVAEATVLDTERRRRIWVQLRRLGKHALAQSWAPCLLYCIILYCIVLHFNCNVFYLEIAPCSVRPTSRTSTGKEELCIFVLVILCLYLYLHLYTFATILHFWAPTFCGILIKLYLVSKCFSHFQLSLVLPGDGQ